MISNPKICVVGLGYVGLPLAVALAKHFTVVGFDINESRVKELKQHHDRTGEITSEALKQSSITLTSNTKDIKGYHVYIITVPTPITESNRPDLSPLRGASETIGKAITKNAVVVYESTVYPGVTEEICGPILEEHSGLKAGEDFFLGYSPERINPGDKEHTVDRITKVVAGQNSEVTELLERVYGTMNNHNIFSAASIKAAEAAKVIENAQRDINIAFVNEISTIFTRMGISIYDVLDAAKTKWNFLDFKPGLVGGHCIGVDPYYLAHAARQCSYEPAVILSGRRINENMSLMIANHIHEQIKEKLGVTRARILVLGLTFKENIPDLRNTKVHRLVTSLEDYGHKVDVHDGHADKQEAKDYYDISLQGDINSLHDYDAVVGAVPHNEYRALSTKDFSRLLGNKGLVADIKNMWRSVAFDKGISYWSL